VSIGPVGMKISLPLIRNALSEFANRQPWMAVSLILIALIVLNTGNEALLNAGFALGTPHHSFPISLFPGSPNFHPNGPAGSMPYTILFLVLLFFAVRSVRRLAVPWVLVLSSALVLSGNLIQGDFSSAFVRPFTATTVQYYHDAARVGAPLLWLRSFNESQVHLLCHSRTHPPFAVLIHSVFLSLGGITGLSCAFVVLSLTQIPLFYVTARALLLHHCEDGRSAKDAAKALTLVYSVLPAVNIYSVICLDALIAVAFLIALLGLVLTDRKLNVPNVAILTAGFSLANALTFGGTFLIAVLGIVGLYRAVRSRSYNLLIGSLATFSFGILLIVAAHRFFQYDHLRAFFTAARLENPDGFRLLSDPIGYLGTRVEGLAEILLFLGVGVLGILMREFPRVMHADGRIGLLSVSGIVVFLLMLASGAFPTGETARCCLFIYPYLLICGSRSSFSVLRDMAVWAGIQTAFMQTIGNYFW